MNITVTDSTRFAILDTWGSIAGDAYEICEGDNEIAMELVLDASRLAMNGFEEADAEIRTLCMEHGFGEVRAALSKKIQLL
jgi:hypothetical protein